MRRNLPILILGGYVTVALLFVLEVFVYTQILDQFMRIARVYAGLGHATEATLTRVIPAVAIPAIAVVVAAVTFWLSRRNVLLSLLIAAIFTLFVEGVAIILSVPAVPIG